MNRLQVRLLLAFGAVLLVMLLIIGGVLIVFLRSRPVAVDDLLNDLTLVSLQTAFRGIDSEDEAGNQRPLPLRQILANSRANLDSTAERSGYRLLLIGADGRVVYDSEAGLEGQSLIIQQEQARRIPRLERQIGINAGEYVDAEGGTWVFISRPLFAVGVRGMGAGAGRNLDYLVSTPRPQQSLRRVVSDFGATFFRPLLQAGLFGLLIAFGLSLWLSRSVARPLLRIAQASQQLAAGHYQTRVPLEGPQETRLVAQAFNHMAAEVEATQQAQQDLLANVAHELRTPLTSIQGFSQAIMDGVAPDPNQAAGVIYSEAGRLNRLVAGLLDIARIQAERGEMTRYAVELSALLQGVGESMSIKAQAKEVRLYVEIPPLPRIAGDGDRLAQVFTNLVDNAIKHTDCGGQVSLSAESQPNGVSITIQDSGEGIPADDLPRIFERFYQVDKSRNRGNGQHNAGLGLAISYEIIQAHQGQISVESQAGVGTRFRVWLPLLASDQSTLSPRRRG